MKIKNGFVLTAVGNHSLLVPEGGPASHILSLNRTARFIAACLQTETTREAVLEQLAGKYAASPEDLAESLDVTLDSLREIGALKE